MTGSCSRPRAALPELALLPVAGAMVALAAVLTAVSGRYGYHRDELYFRMLRPSWGYVDEPPLAPLLVHGLSRFVADQAWAIRIPATLATVLSVYVLVLITRELGGGRTAQTVCAWGYAFASLPLLMGHALLTSTLDLPVWPLVVLFVVRAELRREPRWFLAAGLVVGLSTYDKLLVAVLLAALAGGFLLAGPRRVLVSRWVVAGAALALVVGSPNLLYQARHHWPQLGMGRALAAENAGDVRVMELPFLLLMLGPPLVPVWVAGIVSLLRRPEWRGLRAIAIAFPVLLVLVFVMGAQFYYPFGLLAVLFAVGCVPLEGWLRGRRTVLVAVGLALNAAVSALIGLPLLPLSVLAKTPVPGINQVERDTVGWPVYVREIAGVYGELPRAGRAHTVIVTSNYGEAGAVDRYGGAYRLPRALSAHNELYFVARPSTQASTAIVVGGEVRRATALFGSCSVRARLDDDSGVDNEEQGEPIAVCRRPRGGWSAVWPALKHEG